MKGYEGKYSISNKGRVRAEGKQIIKKPDASAKSTTYVFWMNQKPKKITLTGLMREHWRFEFLSQLSEDEEVKELGNYYVTNKGRIWSNWHYRWIVPEFEYPYYWKTRLFVDGVRRNFKIHTLVGRLFLDNWSEGLQILHKDEKLEYPEVNYVSNLWVGNQSENILDCISKGRQGPNSGKIPEHTILKIRDDWSNGLSRTLICEKYSLSREAARRIITRQTYAHIN